MRLEVVLANSGGVVAVQAWEGVVSGVHGLSKVEEANETRRNDGSRKWRCTQIATGRSVDVWTGYGDPYPRPDSLVATSRNYYTTALRRDVASLTPA